MANKNTKKEKTFRAYFKHYRNGKIYYAKDYGYKAWPFGK